MAFSETDVSALAAAIASGVMRVKFADGREVFYQTGGDLRAAYELARSSVSAASAAPPQRMTRVVHVRT